MKPSLETIIGLYRAARDQQIAAKRAMERVKESMKRHGYSVAQVEAPPRTNSDDILATPNIQQT